MPYRWQHSPTAERRTELHLWQHRALTPQGFTWFMGSTAALAFLPLSSLIGTRAMLIVLAFFLVIIGSLWWAIVRHYHASARSEILILSPDEAHLSHLDPKAAPREWRANPFWITPTLHRDHKIPNYLTLRGGPREVELGAFLTPQERQQLYFDLNFELDSLRKLNQPGQP